MKVLVCITPQANGKRLIDKGFDVLRDTDDAVHILYVPNAGEESLFGHDEMSAILQDLFNYGASKGASIHAVVSDDVAKTIGKTAKQLHAKEIIIGAANAYYDKSNDVLNKLTKRFPNKKITVIPLKETDVVL